MNFELSLQYIDDLKAVIETKDSQKAVKLLKDLHAADIKDIFDELNVDEAKFLFLLLEGELAADVIAELDDDDREKFLKVLPANVIAEKYIEFMDSDDAADVLADLSEAKKSEVLQHISDLEQAGDIIDLLAYDEDTAGGLMGKEYIAVNINENVDVAIEEIRKQAAEIDEVYYVYVINDDNILQGALSLKKLILTSREKKIRDIYEKDVKFVRADLPAEEVAVIAQKYDLVALPVVDRIGRLLGRITFDDINDVLKEEAEKDYQMISGITEDVEHSDNLWIQTRARLPWLLIGLFGGLMDTRVIGHFESNIAEHAMMAFFIPLIGAMGGNVGVQSSSIVVQGLANKSIGLESTWKKILKEISVALVNGFVCSALVFLYNKIFSDSFALTITVSLSLFSVIIFASIFGTFIPLALNKMKIDPALATGPFITTSNDIIGLLIYLSLGAYLFSVL